MSLLAGCVLGLTAAWAGPVDTYGFGAAAIGRGNGGVAVPDGGLTAFRNPALLQDLSWAEATLGYAFNRSAFPAPPPLHWDTNRDGRISLDEFRECFARAPDAVPDAVRGLHEVGNFFAKGFRVSGWARLGATLGSGVAGAGAAVSEAVGKVGDGGARRELRAANGAAGASRGPRAGPGPIPFSRRLGAVARPSG